LLLVEVELLRQAVRRRCWWSRSILARRPTRLWLTSGAQGLIREPLSLPVLHEGADTLTRLIGASGVTGPPVIGVEATGGLHRA
jgi:hypothetical protein